MKVYEIPDYPEPVTPNIKWSPAAKISNEGKELAIKAYKSACSADRGFLVFSVVLLAIVAINTVISVIKSFVPYFDKDRLLGWGIILPVILLFCAIFLQVRISYLESSKDDLKDILENNFVWYKTISFAKKENEQFPTNPDDCCVVYVMKIMCNGSENATSTNFFRSRRPLDKDEQKLADMIFRNNYKKKDTQHGN